MAGKRSAGDVLRRKMDAFLRSHGAAWEWDEHEQAALDAACASADRAERLKVLWDRVG
jgi:hypothetical protein